MAQPDDLEVRISIRDGVALQTLAWMTYALLVRDQPYENWTTTLIRKLMQQGFAPERASRGRLAVELGELNKRLRFAIGADEEITEPHTLTSLMSYLFVDEPSATAFAAACQLSTASVPIGTRIGGRIRCSGRLM